MTPPRPLRVATAACTILALAGLLPVSAEAQYFGRNKVQYQKFDFQVLHTEHFDIYHYPEEAEAVQVVSRLAERWYARFSEVFDHTLSGRQPLILYASHPHFEQTDAISGMLGEGTGGVTEGLKRRIVMPMASGLAETNHVLGHELVHAFQYDILGPRMRLPLWFVEGMAEYFSIGSVAPQTAIWIRDAALAEDLPTIEDLYDPRYFPYRFGHAFWAYVGGRFGDEAVVAILREAGGGGGRGGSGPAAGDPIGAIERVLGIDSEALTTAWHAAIAQEMVRPLGERPSATGRAIISPENEREINVGPALSPDGSRIAFLSSRGLLSIDLYLADTQTGEIERQLTSTAGDPHFDSLQFIESAGAWDPEGATLAVTAVRSGRPVIALIDADSGDRLREIALPGVDEAFHPAWSPDGRTIAFSGLAGGQSDLFLLDLESATVTRLTEDLFADLEPDWSPDGRRLAFVTERYSTDLGTLAFGLPQLATIDVASRAVEPLSAFEDARHSNPQWGADGQTLYFIANPDGIPNVYRLDANGGIQAITSVPTGVTGITAMSPALSVAGPDDDIAFVAFTDGRYAIRGRDAAAPLPTIERTTFNAALLPPPVQRADQVNALLSNPRLGLPASAPTTVEPYDPDLALDYIGQQFGVGNISRLGTYIGGGIAFRFSDILGQHTVSALAQVNGGFEDIGGQLGYVNRTHRWGWGGFLQRAPYTTGFIATGIDDIDGRPAIVEQEVRDRQVNQQFTALAEYPLSRATRIEVTASARRLTFDREVTNRAFDINTGRQIAESEESIPLSDPLNLGEAGLALVRDTSVFGATGPILGHRSRFEIAPAAGGLTFTTALADVRHYVMPFRPVTLAARALYIGRFGGDGDSPRLQPLFVGYPNLVRGYEVGSFTASECGSSGGCPAFEQLIGSRLLVAGGEIRAPLVGLFTGELDYGPLPVELFGFVDAGVAWTGDTSPSGFGSGGRPWARSAGAGLRVNVFGYLIFELDAVRPFDRPDDGWRFTFGIRPGY